MDIFYTRFDTVVGAFLIAGTEAALHMTAFSTGPRERHIDPSWREDPAPLAYALPSFEAYFAGETVEFDIAHVLNGTPFQNSVWEALKTIRYGTTASYGDIAAHIGKPRASQAVGAANGANPLPVLVPCHRIIGADGSMTGFGGGIETKQTLLELEGIATDRAQRDLFESEKTPL